MVKALPLTGARQDLHRCALDSLKSSFPVKSFLTAGAIILVLYFAVFHGIEGCRTAKGPWQVTFASSNGLPLVQILQPRLNISQTLLFHGEFVAPTNAPQMVMFDRPKKLVPFGKVIYEDLTQLPGVVTFDLFGNAVELMPRALIVNDRAVPWGATPWLDLWPTNKPSQPPKPAPGWK